MNRKIFSVIVLVCAITLSGCGFTESSELMTGARKFIENGEYDKAMTNLSKVLDEDESNSEARGMYYQAMKLKKAKKCNDRKDYEQEIKELQDLLNDNSGSAKVRSQAEEMLAKAQESLKNQNRATITRKENAKKSAEENKNNYRSGTTYNSGQAEEMLAKAQESLKNQNRATITRKENAKKSAEENKNNYRSGTTYNSGLYSQRKYDYGYKQDDTKESNDKSDVGGTQSNSGNNYNNNGNNNQNYTGSGSAQGQNSTATGNQSNTGSNQGQTTPNTGGTHQSQSQGQGQTQGAGN